MKSPVVSLIEKKGTHSSVIFVQNKKEKLDVQFLKSFNPIISLFFVVGIVIDIPEAYNLTRIHHYLRIFTKNLCSLFTVFTVSSQLLWLLELPEKKVEAPFLFAFILQTSAYLTIYRSRHQIEMILKRLSHISKSLEYSTDYRKRKLIARFYCGLLYGLIVVYVFYYFYSGQRRLVKEHLKNSSFFKNILRIPGNYAMIYRDVSLCCYSLGNSLAMTSTAACFTFMCIQMKALFHHLGTQIRDLKVRDDFYRLFDAYNELVAVVNLVDDVFSYSALVIVVNCMTGLFRVIYSLVFVREICFQNDFYFCFMGFYYLIILLSVISMASETVQFGKHVQELIVSIPGSFPSHYHELKLLIKIKNVKRKVALTLWKMYAIDRSLVVSALGTFTTYGLLFATLGNVQNQEKN
ncbi:uncharacterized protein TNCT_451 [Trichonephila clavata]|uniref:Gustatory receptor n=1 Tax=Trichonephila clavata TaxID=2740835 RepID=A0A8X6HG40_TRICU|nr:uncharacterized protein TNCT_451 [Trichonephila clavata]